MTAAKTSSLVGLAALGLLGYQPTSEAADGCRGAEPEITRFKSWADVVAWHARFGRCDDGCAAEALDRRIVEMLVKSWDTVPKLRELSDAQPRFKRFVFRHIDGESDPQNLRKIRTKASKSCPAGLEDFCREVHAAAGRALALQARAEASEKKREPAEPVAKPVGPAAGGR